MNLLVCAQSINQSNSQSQPSGHCGPPTIFSGLQNLVERLHNMRMKVQIFIKEFLSLIWLFVVWKTLHEFCKNFTFSEYGAYLLNTHQNFAFSTLARNLLAKFATSSTLKQHDSSWPKALAIWKNVQCILMRNTSCTHLFSVEVSFQVFSDIWKFRLR